MRVQRKSHLPKTATAAACLLTLTLLSPPGSFVRAEPGSRRVQNEPGTNTGLNTGLQLPQGPKSVTALAGVVTATGLVNYSIDGAGFTGACGNLRVQKPAGATVRNAYLLSATTGFSGRTLVTGDVTLNG